MTTSERSAPALPSYKSSNESPTSSLPVSSLVDQAPPLGTGAYNRSKSAWDVKGSLHEQLHDVQPNLIGSVLSYQSTPTSGSQQTSRPRSQEISVTTDMAEQDDQATTHDAGLDRNTSAQARRDAFSEDQRRSSSHHSSGRVDRQIEATMNDAEPTSNARSRKASHVLGLFRENKSPSESQKGSRKPRTKSSGVSDDKPIRRASKPEEVPPISGAANVAQKNEASASHRGQQEPAPMQPVDRGGASTPETVQVSKADQHPPAALPKSPHEPDPGNGGADSQLEPHTHSGSAIEGSGGAPATPADITAKLLEEIRDYHNLAPPVHDKFRSTQIKVVGPNSDASGLQQRAQPRDECLGQDGPEKPDSQDKSSASPTDEDEESDKEHISSALYYPHQVPSPEALQDVSIHDARKTKIAEDLEPRLPEPAIPAAGIAEEPPCEVDITLQTHNKSKHLHGDLQKARSPSGAEADYSQFIEGGTSSASESEYESTEEIVHPSVREDSSLTDDPDATPRASPTTRKSFLQSRYRRSHRKPKAPVGAVELKPYNHQVGGHSRVFRFSKRAVCKELSNRENVFYEAVEHQHPELLKFLPRYVDQSRDLCIVH